MLPHRGKKFASIPCRQLTLLNTILVEKLISNSRVWIPTQALDTFRSRLRSIVRSVLRDNLTCKLQGTPFLKLGSHYNCRFNEPWFSETQWSENLRVNYPAIFRWQGQTSLRSFSASLIKFHKKIELILRQVLKNNCLEKYFYFPYCCFLCFISETQYKYIRIMCSIYFLS